MGSRRAGLSAAVAVCGVLLVVVLVTWAASIGPSGVLTGPGPTVDRTSEPTEESPSDEPSAAEPDVFDDLRDGGPEPQPLLGYVALALMVAGLGFVVALGYRTARRAWAEHAARRRPAAAPDEREFDVVSAPARVAQEIERDAVEQRARLLTGAPRNAVVQCWHRFELQAAAAGLARLPAETSSEFTLRMLDLVEADAGAVGRLSALYREARFSEHELDEGARGEALAALDAVHASLPRSRA
jgi:hypothetical protein